MPRRNECLEANLDLAHINAISATLKFQEINDRKFIVQAEELEKALEYLRTSAFHVESILRESK